MIEFIEGRPGSYKSYTGVIRAVRQIINGGVVATNLHLNVDEIRAYCRKHHDWELQEGQIILLPGDKIADFPTHTPSGSKERTVLIIIEEAGRYFNSRDWNKTGRKVLDFLALSRHEFNDVIFIDQAANNIDKQFRRLVQFYWRCRDLNHFAVKIPWCYYIAQMDYDGKSIVGGPWIKVKDKQVYKLYDSYSRQVVSFDRVKIEKTKFDGKIEKKGLSMKIYAVLVVLVLLCGYAIHGYFKKDGLKERGQEMFSAKAEDKKSVQIITTTEPKKVEMPPAEKSIEYVKFLGWCRPSVYGNPMVLIGRQMYQPHLIYPEGLCLHVDQDKAIFRKPNGKIFTYRNCGTEDEKKIVKKEIDKTAGV